VGRDVHASLPLVGREKGWGSPSQERTAQPRTTPKTYNPAINPGSSAKNPSRADVAPHKGEGARWHCACPSMHYPV